MVIAQIAIINIVFSLDSVITAVGLANHLWVMITAIVLAIGVMMYAARSISEFVEKHPSIKMLALSFLVPVGVALVAEGTGHAMPKGYLYFAMAFSFIVEMLNLRLWRRRVPVRLHQAYAENPRKDKTGPGRSNSSFYFLNPQAEPMRPTGPQQASPVYRRQNSLEKVVFLDLIRYYTTDVRFYYFA